MPAAGVDVTLSTFADGVARARTVTTDTAGVFAFGNIAEGTYLLATVGGDFQMACFANADAGDRCAQIPLRADEHRDDFILTLTPNAIARGRIVDEKGTPIAGASVRITMERRPLPNGGFASVVSTRLGVTTAADGTFEVRGIAPGAWYLETSLPAAKGSIALPVIFYPGVFHHDDATRIEFAAGRVSDHLELVVPASSDNILNVHLIPGPVPTADVRAAVFRSSPFITRTVALDDNGDGTMSGLLPGRYFIAARGWIKDRAWAAFEIVDFLPPSIDLTMQMKPAGSIRGKIVAQNGGLPPLDGLVVAAAWTHDDVEINPIAPDQVPVEADGSFKIDGLFGERALRLIGLSADWAIYAIRQGRTELRGAVEVPLDSTVDITIVLARR